MEDLYIERLTKAYTSGSSGKSEASTFALQSVTLHIPKGERFTIVGPSGCGKTTLLKCIAGLIAPDEGAIIYGSRPLHHVPAEKRGFGMIFQQPMLFPHMTVLDNVAFGLKLKGWSKQARYAAARELLAAVALTGFEARYPAELSGGQQQRVAFARAIVNEPTVLLLDEPFSALDPGIRSELRQLLNELQQRYRFTMVLVTHDRDEAFELSDRIALMNEGTVLQIGHPMELYAQPVNRVAARLVGAGTLIEGVLEDARFRSSRNADFSVTLSCNDVAQPASAARGWLVLPPERVRRAVDAELEALRATVLRVHWRQGMYELQLDVQGEIIRMNELSYGQEPPLVGSVMLVCITSGPLHVIPMEHAQ
ncbi:ABC transporter ATP-binding protein [Paenibacillus sp. YYML68]|uniref:ABC transporter ATP-binding protein n=1 Tax=Paenibacillus sp. YYML68 TaxID=2909250 RepID=UPI002491EAF5|nr:ABC transporter ATP-binding protein [Paenibacillus sp. YYML68]